MGRSPGEFFTTEPPSPSWLLQYVKEGKKVCWHFYTFSGFLTRNRSICDRWDVYHLRLQFLTTKEHFTVNSPALITLLSHAFLPVIYAGKLASLGKEHSVYNIWQFLFYKSSTGRILWQKFSECEESVRPAGFGTVAFLPLPACSLPPPFFPRLLFFNFPLTYMLTHKFMWVSPHSESQQHYHPVWCQWHKRLLEGTGVLVCV